MPENQKFNQVRGRIIRVTRLDACGAPLPGESAVVMSKGISSISVEEVSEEGNSIRDRNFGGELHVVDDAQADLIGFNLDINLSGVNPDLITLLTGQPVVKNAAGDTVGFDVDGDIDVDGFGFALEVWTRIAGQACAPGGHRKWGYTLFPFIKGGRLGGFTFEDAAVQFTVTGAQTKVGNSWGVGPFDVDRGVNGDPSPLFTPIAPTRHYRNIYVTLDPPQESIGAIALPAPTP